MNFVSTRIITNDIAPLVRFYEDIGLQANWFTGEFAELKSPACTLAVGTKTTMDRFFGGAATPGSNRAVILEFIVDDVDALFQTLKARGKDIVQAPTTQPWGNRSLLVRDPDGNLVNFFTPVTPEAVQRFAKA
ncbi:VOC family protein [Paraburkholderia acidisoli]|uniref:VOC family protein n=1 Tax=Paraburkholderia acidisoli TaxID=2571748 RepID=A0A7Z2GML1_9BURK|nr:VOC family protein [Paraburkholderia acidisoli]QGZ64300.1 VOC family protein [Paraburkholderia acidisoli]